MDQPFDNWITENRGARTSAKNGCLLPVAILATMLCLVAFGSVSNPETTGPFKNRTQVVDWQGDGDLDVIVSHTRWERVDISWAGVGIWINQGDGAFELYRDRGTGGHPFGGFAAAAGDVDQDGDLDLFTFDQWPRLLLNMGGVQGGEPGKYASNRGIELPPAYREGYRDMGGTIELGDLTGDGRIDAFVAHCCYGFNARRLGAESAYAPSLSLVWVNDGRSGVLQAGHVLPLDSLEGLPIREAALGDLDGDGDLDIYAAVGKPTLGRVNSIDDRILLNDGAGNFTPYDHSLGETDSTSVALGDVNGDGHLDALVGTTTGARLWLNQGDEMGSDGLLFTKAEQSFPAVQSAGSKVLGAASRSAGTLLGIHLPYGSIRTQAVFLEDLDGDGDLDALLARLWAAEIWWNDGQGEFRRSDQRFAYREDTGVAVADFDADGDPDIFIGRNEDDHQLWWNDGMGAFRQEP